MKLSLRWIFDHIDANWNSIPLSELTQSFIKSTAEIEAVQSVSCPVRSWFIACASSINPETVAVTIPELRQTVTLPMRPEVHVGAHYLIKKDEDTYLWVSMRDVGSSKEGLLPAFTAQASELLGAWRDRFEAEDAIITVDNKSINHRPDLWGHRGIAREIAAKYQLPLVGEHQFLAQHQVQATPENQGTVASIKINNQSNGSCTRFAAVALSQIINKLSDLEIVVRLARAEVRSIDSIVDMTNYVMLDFGHPLHAFDSAKITDSQLIIRHAKNEEQVSLLDNSTVKLQEADIVIADEQKPLSLAGIMGGSSSAVSTATTSILVEAACFDSNLIRRTSTRLSKRTESSSRFEKGLNAAIVEKVLLRFLKLLHDYSIQHRILSPVVALGAIPEIKTILIKHSVIEACLGITLASDFIKSVLQRLDFSVVHHDDSYEITVPHARLEDIAIEQDIIEEIGRLYGYDQIPPIYANREMKPFTLNSALAIRQIKRHLSYGLHMREMLTYAFFDEAFLKKIEWEPVRPLQVKEAVSENWRRLVTTLTPNLLARVHQSADLVPALNLYECAQIWPYQETGTQEKTVLSGIFADFKKQKDFYEGKAALQSLFTILNIDVRWQKIEQPPYPWYIPYQTAWLFHHEHCIGIAGKANPLFYQKVALGDAFIWEIDAHYLLNFQAPVHRYKAPSKYPRVTRDLSVLIDRSKTVDELLKTIAEKDSHIFSVTTVDFFEKKEWHDSWALTFRIVLEDHEKTLTNAEVDAIISKITDYLASVGAQIR